MLYSCKLHTARGSYLVAIIDDSTNLITEIQSVVRQYAKDKDILPELHANNKTSSYGMDFIDSLGNTVTLAVRVLTTWKVGMYKLEGDIGYRF